MKKVFATMMGLFLSLAPLTTATAGKTPTPETLEGGKVIAAGEARALAGKEGVHFFDMRKAVNYGRGHLPGAVSSPYRWTSKGDVKTRTGEFDISKLPGDKNATVVFYSNGPTGWKSYKAAREAIKAGYKNVLYFRGGFTAWSEKGYPVEK